MTRASLVLCVPSLSGISSDVVSATTPLLVITKSGSLVPILLLDSRPPLITLPVVLSIHRSQKHSKLKHFQG